MPTRYAWECAYCPYTDICEWAERSKGRDGDKTGIKKSSFFSLADPEDPESYQSPGVPIEIVEPSIPEEEEYHGS